MVCPQRARDLNEIQVPTVVAAVRPVDMPVPELTWEAGLRPIRPRHPAATTAPPRRAAWPDRAIEGRKDGEIAHDRELDGALVSFEGGRLYLSGGRARETGGRAQSSRSRECPTHRAVHFEWRRTSGAEARRGVAGCSSRPGSDLRLAFYDQARRPSSRLRGGAEGAGAGVIVRLTRGS